MTTIALFGAGGKMGCRISDRLRDSGYSMRYIESGAAGIATLRERGLAPSEPGAALPEADVVILAVPDRAIGAVATAAMPAMRPGALLICLDPAAPAAGRLALRPDIASVVVHPCHPSVFNDELDLEARHDYFGAVKASQHIVCALVQGAEEDYARAEAIARLMFAPVLNAHRVTVEQMTILEPALVETLAATCLTVIREGMDEAVRRGVPAEAARDFLLGHLNIELAVVFGQVGSPFSDGALLAIEHARPRLFQPDWKRIFEPEQIRASVEAITGGSSGADVATPRCVASAPVVHSGHVAP